ncbi:esterase [Phycicoccus sp. Root563]|uniref:alpha/beta fold hydrolase n=1 Tax=unclassified Phycicoccus TaxID=2637926 RepID=UPI0007031394|nr:MULTISPECIES: alpha/beta fold hydrolase [unclassified Phycicoccus]KQU70594.1 esterase [Phycicoccus sp. Root101]KQZ88896.1 esterase [Phycicoccus sp. Root563]
MSDGAQPSGRGPSLHTLSVGTAGPRVAFLHGLFGQGRNWSQIAKALAGPGGDGARSTLVDLPDHGRSPWTEEFSFTAYADAVAATLRGIDADARWMVVGHSLGGKTAMLLALRHPELVARLVVVDIAPKSYGSLDRFSGYIAEMERLPLDDLTSRGDAEARFEEPNRGVKAFLMQNLRRDGDTWHWQANLGLFSADAAKGTGSVIAGWPDAAADLAPYDGPVLWIAGSESEYIRDEDLPAMQALFPKVRQLTVKGASHWVHTDAPEVVVEALRRFVRPLAETS